MRVIVVCLLIKNGKKKRTLNIDLSYHDQGQSKCELISASDAIDSVVNFHEALFTVVAGARESSTMLVAESCSKGRS